jgi:hypothetical protein
MSPGIWNRRHSLLQWRTRCELDIAERSSADRGLVSFDDNQDEIPLRVLVLGGGLRPR